MSASGVRGDCGDTGGHDQGKICRIQRSEVVALPVFETKPHDRVPLDVCASRLTRFFRAAPADKRPVA
jgi:hypothetical protein